MMWFISLFKRAYPHKVIPIDTYTLPLVTPADTAISNLCKSLNPMCDPLCKNAQCMSLVQQELLKIILER